MSTLVREIRDFKINDFINQINGKLEEPPVVKNATRRNTRVAALMREECIAVLKLNAF